MPLLKEDYRKQEKIDGIFYDMSIYTNCSRE